MRSPLTANMIVAMVPEAHKSLKHPVFYFEYLSEVKLEDVAYVMW